MRNGGQPHTAQPETSPKPKEKSILPQAFVALLLLATTAALTFGIAVLSGFESAVQQHAMMTTAIEVESRILHISLDKQVPMSRRGNTTYVPRIEFAYSINGKHYISNKIYPTDAVFQHKEDADKVINAFSLGEITTAYVDPQRPGSGFLLRRWDDEPFIGPLGFIFLIELVCSMACPIFSSHPRTLTCAKWIGIAGAFGVCISLALYAGTFPFTEMTWRIPGMAGLTLLLCLMPMYVVHDDKYMRKLLTGNRPTETQPDDSTQYLNMKTSGDSNP